MDDAVVVAYVASVEQWVHGHAQNYNIPEAMVVGGVMDAAVTLTLLRSTDGFLLLKCLAAKRGVKQKLLVLHSALGQKQEPSLGSTMPPRALPGNVELLQCMC